MTTVVDTPSGLKMFGLLQARHRLHLEIGSGMSFRQSTVAALQRAGVTDSRNRWTALYDVNRAISAAGGPADTQSLALQRALAGQGKPSSYPPKGR